MTIVAAVTAGFATWLLLPPPVTWQSPVVGWRRMALLPVSGALFVMPGAWAAPALVLVLGCAGAAALWRRRTFARRAERTAAVTAEVCDLLAAELAAGRPPGIALEEAAHAWSGMRPVADVCRLGGDVPSTLREVSLAPGAGGLRLLAAAWAVSHRTGGGLAAATRRVAESVRREQSLRRVVAGELASARATARLVAGLPVVALLMGSGAGADPWVFLFHTRAGLGCLGAGLAVGLLGLWWIELIARAVDQ